jgi:hypothetical protein
VTAVFAVVLILLVAAFIVFPLLSQRDDAGTEMAPVRDELWKREKAVAVLAITEADFDRATGKLSDDDYRVLRSDYEGRALQAMDEMDKLVPAPSQGVDAGVKFCASCGARFASQDAFCGSCGRPRFGGD